MSDEVARASDAPDRGLSRVMALSDGVFAIAVTLLVLAVKEGQGSTLMGRLVASWPYYLAFGLSFLVIGVMWLNHHRLLRHVSRLATPAMLANLALLAAVSFLPFPTAVLAEHVWDRSSDATTAAAFYSLACLFVSGSFFLLTEAIRRDPTQHGHPETRMRLGRMQVRGWFAPVAYLGAFVLAFVSPPATMILFIAIPLAFIRGAVSDDD